jgi:hypothetical protein
MMLWVVQLLLLVRSLVMLWLLLLRLRLVLPWVPIA